MNIDGKKWPNHEAKHTKSEGKWQRRVIEKVSESETKKNNRFKEDKKYDIISVSRPSIQKVNKKLEKEVVRDFGEIKRKNTNSWEQYYKFLSQAKIVLLSGKEETFGYQVLEAIMNCSTPLAPKNFSYPELLSDEYLYSNYEELRVKICQVLNGTLLSPKKLLCHDLCENFYENIVKEMNGD